jgi:protein-disulfide isomerase
MSHKIRSSIFILSLLLLRIPTGAQTSEPTGGMILSGSLNAPVKIEVFSDFECSACSNFYQAIIRPLLQEYAGRNKVCVIYREFPLNRHKYSRNAAIYCEAAYRLGREKTVRVMDALFAEQARWAKDGNIEAIVAKALSSQDMLKVKAIVRDPSLNLSIDQGVKLGIQKGINGTPTMFVYYQGKMERVEDPQQLKYKTMKDFIDQRIQ